MTDESILKNTGTSVDNATYINDCIKEVCLNGDSLAKYQKLIEKQCGVDLYDKCDAFVKEVQRSVDNKRFSNTSIINLKYLAKEIGVTTETVDVIVSHYSTLVRNNKSGGKTGIWIVMLLIALIGICCYFAFNQNEKTPVPHVEYEESSSDIDDQSETSKSAQTTGSKSYATTSPATVSDEYQYGKVVDEDGYTNIRKEPTTDSPIIGDLKDGSRLFYREIAGSSWYKVYSLSKQYYGYMYSGKIRHAYVNDLKRGTVLDEDGYTNVRKGPSTETEVLTTVRDGSSLMYETTTTSWYKVYDLEGRCLGYMHSNKVRN